MKLTSSNFKQMQKIPVKFTKDGQNLNPALEINEAPKDAKSFVLIIEDPDAPSGNWVHWLIWDIPAEITEIKENSIPGVQGKNSWGENRYGGPKPPFGTHRYFFRIYALDTFLNLNESSLKYEVEKAMQKHVLDSTELIGLYR